MAVYGVPALYMRLFCLSKELMLSQCN